MELESSEPVPAMAIQCDWEDFIDVPHKQVWVSCKQRGEPSCQGYIRGGTLASDSDLFSAVLGRNSLCVKFSKTGHNCRFIPACKLFSKLHSKAVRSLDAADGGLAVSTCDAHKLVVWDKATGESRRELTGHVGHVYKCLLFPSGIVVLSAGADGCIKIWSAETGQCAVTLTGHSRAVTDLAIIDRGRNIASVSKDGTARLWHVGQAVCLDKVLETNSELTCCSIGPAPLGVDTRAPLDDRHVGTQGKVLLAGSEQGDIFAVALSSSQLAFSLNVYSAVNAVLYFSAEQFIVGTQDGRLQVYKLLNGSLLRTIHESNSPVLCLALFRDKGVLAGRQDGSVSYNSLLSDTQDRVQLTGPDCDPVTAIAVTSDHVLTACRDGKVRSYQVSDLLAGGV